jgi:hypothetical protein
MGLYDTGSTQAVIGAIHDAAGAINRLTEALNRASNDSGKVANRIVWLTGSLVVVGMLQIGAAMFAVYHTH